MSSPPLTPALAAQQLGYLEGYWPRRFPVSGPADPELRAAWLRGKKIGEAERLRQAKAASEMRTRKNTGGGF